MTSRDASIVGELVGLLSTKGHAPRSAVGCQELIQYLVEAIPQYERIAASLAWRLIEMSASAPDPPDATQKPLLASKHLLALGNYPSDIEVDTKASIEDIRNTKPRSSDVDPVRWVTVRRKIASRAGGYGEDPSNLSPGHAGRRLDRVARALWAEMKSNLSNPEAMVALATAVDVSAGGKDAQVDPAREVAVRRLRRMHARKISTRVRRTAFRALKLGFVAASVWLVGTVLGVVLNTIAGGDRATDIDPLDAMNAGGGWDEGVGPNNDIRAENNLDGLAINVAREYWALVPIIQGSFMELTGDFTSYEGFEVMEAGEYRLEVPVMVEYADYWGNEKGETSGAEIQLGILPKLTGPERFSVFARLQANRVSPVWDGVPLHIHPECDCTVAIDPGSIRLYSDAVPEGIPVQTEGPTLSTLIGFEGFDGVLRSGWQNEVRVVASVVVSERKWSK